MLGGHGSLVTHATPDRRLDAAREPYVVFSCDLAGRGIWAAVRGSMSKKERAAVDWSPEFLVCARENLHETQRYDEDGDRIVKSTFTLVATGKRGHRWASPHVHQEWASAKSERRHLSRDFDPVKAGWYEIEPMYGSEAWTPAVEARLAEEERRAEGWSEGFRW